MNYWIYLIAVLFIAGVAAILMLQPSNAANYIFEPSNGCNLTDMNVTALMMESCARLSTNCSHVGVPIENMTIYNNNSDTWWMTLDQIPAIKNPMCSPACVIYNNGTFLEVNWRCTGLKV